MNRQGDNSTRADPGCNCSSCRPFDEDDNPVVNLATVRRDGDVSYLDNELSCHLRLLADLGERAARLAANYSSAELTVATFAIYGAVARLGAALAALDRLAVSQ